MQGGQEFEADYPRENDVANAAKVEKRQFTVY